MKERFEFISMKFVDLIDSANRLILYRLQDRARLLRDSLRADSLRRDSIAKRIRP